MPRCSGCSEDFIYLDTNECQACQKKSELPKDRWNEIDNQAQCTDCGVVWRHLKSQRCAPCQKRHDGIAPGASISVGNPTVALAQSIGLSAGLYEKQASDTRLHQSVHTGTAKSATVQNIISKTAAMRKQNKSDDIVIDVVMFYWPLNGGVARKIQANKFGTTFPSAQLATDVLDTLFRKAELTHSEIPEDRRPSVSFLAEDSTVEISLVQGSDNRKIDDSFLTGTVGELFTKLQKSGALLEKTEKTRKLPLRFTAWEKKTVVSDDCNESDKDSVIVIPVRKKRSTSAPAVSPASKRNRKDSKVISRERYQSAFRAEFAASVLPPPPVETLKYQVFQFKRSDYELDEEGRMTEFHEDELEEIEIADGWVQYIKGGIPQNGYISKGLSKYAFKGRIGKKEYAIFQGIPGWTFDSFNTDDLHHELKLLRRGEYFLKDFKRRVGYGQSLHMGMFPDISWHSEVEAFVGTISPQLKLVGNTAVEQHQNLVFNTFLAAPLLDVEGPGVEEVRFLGNTDVVNAMYGLPAIVSAFVHSALVDSKGQFLFADLQGFVYPGTFPDQAVVLFDPQAHTPSRTSGHWDLGPKQIYHFLEEHKCNKYCRMADLDDIATFDESLIESTVVSGDVEGDAQGSANEVDSVDMVPKRSHPLREGFD